MGSNPSEEVNNFQPPENSFEVNIDILGLMQQKISSTPRILSKAAGRSSCCIFRIPQSFVEINGRAYQPNAVSIGPYHHADPKLEMMEEQKWRLLGDLLKRRESHGLLLTHLVNSVQEIEIQARECYSENIQMDSDDFVKMLVLDGCFVIEVLRMFCGDIPVRVDDPIHSILWVHSFLLRDLVRLENQIPFFILQRLFDLTNPGRNESLLSLTTLAMKFFNNALGRPEEIIAKFSDFEGNHIIDLLRSSYILPGFQEKSKKRHIIEQDITWIQPISKLRKAGIKLRPGDEKSFLSITFRRHGVIEMPKICIDDFMIAFLYNCVAYEQCHRGYSNHMTAYAVLLDSLINTASDVEYLCDRNIIENSLGTEDELAKFVNNIGKELTLDIKNSFLRELFVDVNKYYQSTRHVQWASFRYTYFSTTWSFISAMAALELLVLTILQTFYAIIGYGDSKSS